MHSFFILGSDAGSGYADLPGADGFDDRRQESQLVIFVDRGGALIGSSEAHAYRRGWILYRTGGNGYIGEPGVIPVWL